MQKEVLLKDLFFVEVVQDTVCSISVLLFV